MQVRMRQDLAIQHPHTPANEIAQHRGHDGIEHALAVHLPVTGCLLITETSCERRNDFLDRALVVATVDAPGAEFFRDQP
jgi:hypothetical protein